MPNKRLICITGLKTSSRLVGLTGTKDEMVLRVIMPKPARQPKMLQLHWGPKFLAYAVYFTNPLLSKIAILPSVSI